MSTKEVFFDQNTGRSMTMKEASQNYPEDIDNTAYQVEEQKRKRKLKAFFQKKAKRNQSQQTKI